MNTLVAKLILSGLLLFGGLGGTAAVAADSLPDSPVYALKLAMEQTRLALTNQPEQAARLHLTLAEERAREVERLALKGTPAGAAALTRLEQQLQLALDAAADIGDDATLARLLQDAQERFELRVRQLEQARLRSQEQVGEPLLRAQGLLNRARAQASLGSQDPHLFRERHGYGRPATAPP